MYGWRCGVTGKSELDRNIWGGSGHGSPRPGAERPRGRQRNAGKTAASDTASVWESEKRRPNSQEKRRLGEVIRNGRASGGFAARVSDPTLRPQEKGRRRKKGGREGRERERERNEREKREK